ncbi:hypothetical protein [Streptomyces sp. NBC_01601]|uniref:hypothetical protein n=1 Tax=Streptomyces sp. NBC_01601 TaxID=2975892 RepID=UPI002E2D593D|nr:hypothetical protein [Streptomyces sp. NBC_01601]
MAVQVGGVLQLAGAEAVGGVEAGQQAGAAGAVGVVMEGVVGHHLGQRGGVGGGVRVRDSCQLRWCGGRGVSRTRTREEFTHGVGDLQAPAGSVVLAGASFLADEPAVLDQPLVAGFGGGLRAAHEFGERADGDGVIQAAGAVAQPEAGGEVLVVHRSPTPRRPGQALHDPADVGDLPGRRAGR